MDDKPNRPGPVNFRPRGKSQELIARAALLGVNVSAIMNEMLDKHGPEFFEPAIKARKKEMQELLKAA